MDYSVNIGNWGNIFAVPSSVVDDYIKLASGHAVKVLLYMLRNNARKVSKEEIVSALNIDGESVEDAFNFWESVGILSCSGIPVKNDIITENNNIPVQSVVPVQENSISINSNMSVCETGNPSGNITVRRPAMNNSSENFNLRPAEIARRINSSEQIRSLFNLAETALGRMLNNTDQRSLIWIHEYLGLNIDVILTLIAHCVSLGKTNMAYIEKIAFQWQENNVKTLSDAQNEIQRQQQYEIYEAKVMVIFGINTRPSANQTETIKDWYSKNVSIELIECAYNRTMDNTGKLSLPYMNSIIESWTARGLLTISEINDFERNNYAQRKSYQRGTSGRYSREREEQSYNINEFEKYAINYEEFKKVGE
ncbi:MAG: DnaD domain protein [Oscillospiraceae bacterium]